VTQKCGPMAYSPPMEGHEGLAELEHYLRTGQILTSGDLLSVTNGGEPAGGHPDKHRVLLVGGVQALAKPGMDQFESTVKREVAGWLVAKHLGFLGLVAGTVLREVPRASIGEPVLSSVQITWPDGRDWCPSLDTLPEEEVWQAAVFDAVVEHADHNGNNYFGVPQSSSGRLQHLRLVDTGNAFGVGSPRPNSAFFERHEGDELPEPISEALGRLYDDWPSELEDLIGDDEAGKVRERIAELRETGELRIG
jgi:hypothetical protein